ncbi:Wadjet anti-phage system protein JetD domain-containing protein [Psychrobacillus sp. L4]|uniref:Wadjet anti-phage system protein JetD domain-containing protein n=1 Tax=Psychrobacillus sp. L4 TaxID=3236892 RepID=UPI0036F43BB2
MMRDKLMEFKKSYITLSELERLLSDHQTYELFAKAVLELVEAQLLQPVKSAGQTPQIPRLHYKYKVLKHSVKKSLREVIEPLQLTLDPSISLDKYYRLTPQQLEQDLPYIQKINQFILTYNFPTLPAPAPERSQQVVGDEKWLQYKGGRRVLERLGLWMKMQIVDVKEPLRFAVNPQQLHHSTQFHLIVENKTTYEGLLPALKKTRFSTLIYGAGFEIVGSLNLFDKQLPLPNVRHLFYYFGDLDFAGISIWYLVSKQQSVAVALPFYEAALQDEGKPILKKQLRDDEAIEAFMENLPPHIVEKCHSLLEKNNYISQEVLGAAKLQQIWQQMSDDLEE